MIEANIDDGDLVLIRQQNYADEGQIVVALMEDEATLKETVQSALAQIEEKQYAAKLVSRGILAERIRSYGFAFEGKKVLIG